MLSSTTLYVQFTINNITDASTATAIGTQFLASIASNTSTIATALANVGLPVDTTFQSTIITVTVYQCSLPLVLRGVSCDCPVGHFGANCTSTCASNCARNQGCLDTFSFSTCVDHGCVNGIWSMTAASCVCDIGYSGTTCTATPSSIYLSWWFIFSVTVGGLITISLSFALFGYYNKNRDHPISFTPLIPNAFKRE